MAECLICHAGPGRCACPGPGIIAAALAGHDYGECPLCGMHYDCDCPMVSATAPIRLRAEKAEAELATAMEIVTSLNDGCVAYEKEIERLKRENAKLLWSVNWNARTGETTAVDALNTIEHWRRTTSVPPTPAGKVEP